jgi:hypothetical protein
LSTALTSLRRRGVTVALCGLKPPIAAFLDRLDVLPASTEVPRFDRAEQAVAAFSSVVTNAA